MASIRRRKDNSRPPHQRNSRRECATKIPQHFWTTPTPAGSPEALAENLEALSTSQRFEEELSAAAHAAVEDRDIALMREHGVDLEYAWFEMPTRFLATEEGNLEISGGPIRLNNAREGQPHFDPERLAREERHYLAALKNFADQAAVNERCRILLEIDDVSEGQRAALSPQAHLQCLEQLTAFLETENILDNSEKLGTSVGYVCSSDQERDVERLIWHFENSKQGKLKYGDDGSVVWLPGTRLIEKAAIREDDYDSCREVPLRDANGEPTHEALEISSYLDPVNREVTHVHFRSQGDRDYANRVAVALDTLGMADMSTQHDILLDTQGEPQRTGDAVRSLVNAEVDKKLNDMQSHTPPASKDPHAYNVKNYGEIEDFDVETIHEVLASASERGIGLHSLNTVHVPASGAALHWLALASLFVRPGQTLIASDYSERNIEQLREYLGWGSDGKPPKRAPEELSEPWPQWMSVIRDAVEQECDTQLTEEQIWEHLVNVCRPVGGPEEGNMLDLEPEHADMTLQFYGNCSFHTDRDMAYKAVRSQTQATKHRGVVMFINFTGAKDWGDGGNKANIPSNNLNSRNPKDFAKNVWQRLVHCFYLGAGTRPDEKTKLTVGQADNHAQYDWRSHRVPEMKQGLALKA